MPLASPSLVAIFAPGLLLLSFDCVRPVFPLSVHSAGHSSEGCRATTVQSSVKYSYQMRDDRFGPAHRIQSFLFLIIRLRPEATRSDAAHEVWYQFTRLIAGGFQRPSATCGFGA